MKPITTITTRAIRAMVMKLASSAPKPKWLASAARPRPAARPASGPIHERLGAGAGAAAAAGGVACWAFCVGAGLAGVAGAVCCGTVRFMPPPPMRLASAGTPPRLRPTIITLSKSLFRKFNWVSRIAPITGHVGKWG